MDFYEKVKSLVKSNTTFTLRAFIESLGINYDSYNGQKRYNNLPRADEVVKIAKGLNVSLDYLLVGDEKPNKCIVPILDQELSAGNGCLVPENDAAKGLLELPRSLRAEYGDNLSALYVKGDSMEPTLRNGDLIVCDSLGWDSGEGLYAVRLNGKGYVKRIQVGNGKILIKSDNPKYDTIEEPIESQNLQIIGKVHFIGTVNI